MRKQFRFQLEVYAKRTGLRLEVMENKGWLDSDYFIELHGVESKLRQGKSDIEEWLEELS